MATYRETFPRNELGYAHPRSSLADAEQLAPGVVRLPSDLDTGDPFFDAMNQAWSHIEYACATPERVGDANYFDVAEQELGVVAWPPTAVITNPHVLNARLLLGSLPGFRARANYQSPTPDMIDQFQFVTGQVMTEYVTANDPDRRLYSGRLSELMTVYALLLGRHFPFMGSPREEANPYIPDNHDYYIREAEGRIPISVKHVGSFTNNPLVLTLRMAMISRQAIRDAGVPRNMRPNSPEENTQFVAGIMVKHAGDATLDTHEIDCLRQTLRIIEKAMTDFRAAGYSRVDADLPESPRRSRYSPR